MKCPHCGSEDVKHLVGSIYVCRDCGAEIYDVEIVNNSYDVDLSNVKKIDRW